MKKEWWIFKTKGFSVVEVMLATSLFGLLLVALLGAYLYAEESTVFVGSHARALFLAEEGLEAVRNIRDADFAQVSVGTHGLTPTGGVYGFSGTSDTTGIFTRTVTITDIDDNRKEVVSEVSWQQFLRSGSVSLKTRLTNFRARLADWSSPLQEAFLNITGNQNATKVQVSGDYAYVIRNNANTANFYIINISNPALPTLASTLNISGTPQNIFVDNGFVYVTSNADTRELQIIDATNPNAPLLVGGYDDPGTDDGRGIFVVGNRAYVTFASGVDFVVLDVSAPGAPLAIGSLDIDNVPNEVFVSGDYAYIVTSSNTREILVLNLFAGPNPILTGSLNLPGNTDANTITFSSNTIYVGQGNTLRVINVNNPAIPVLLGSVLTSTSITDISLTLGGGGALLYISNSDNASEFQVIDVTNGALPTIFGVLDTAGTDNLNGVAYSTALDRVFGVSDSNTQEFKVFAPQ